MNSAKQLAAVLFSILLIVAGSRLLVAQSGAGSIQGTVVDSTGAVIPGASIHVVNEATGVATNTKSNGVGFYQAPELFTGTYKITVTAPGMKTYVTSLDLLVAQNAVINATLTPGAVTQQVVVSGNAVQLTTTDNGSLTSTLENDRINQLPMNGRNILTLVGYTTPGMEDSGQKMDGQAIEALEYVVDGTSTENNLFGGQNVDDNGQSTNPQGSASTPPTQLLDPDAVQEVRVEASNAGAQYETPATAIVTTKSGTDRLHGTVFETARNNAFGVARRRQDPTNYSAPHLVRNEFGASAGGPIVLPHIYHGKDKSFWFFAYERYSLAESTSSLTAVPTTAMRQGNFGGLISSAGVLQVLYDPSTTQANAACPVPNSVKPTNNPYCRTPFPNNDIPSGESPLASIYSQLIPQPTSSANPLVQGNLTALSPLLQIIPQMTFRLDHVFNANNRGYLRFTQNLGDTNVTGGPRNLAVSSSGVEIPVGAAFGYANSPESSFISSAGFTHIFSPTFFSETIVSQQWLSDGQVPGTAINANYESMLNLPNNFAEPGFPSITGMIKGLGSTQTGNATISQIVSTLDENLTKTVGKNQMQFGGRFRHERNGDKPNGNADSITFGGLPTALYNPSSGANYTAYANTGNANGAFFFGSAGSYSVNLEPPHVHYHLMEFDTYFQDNYHVSKNFTADVGLRYEAHPALWTKYNLQTSFDLKNDAEVLGTTPAALIAEGYTTQAIITNDEDIGVKFETPAEAGMPSKMMRNYDLNFFPRVGLAYLPFDGKWGTVIRGAYGRYDYPTPLEDYANHPEDSNPYTAVYSQSFSTAAQAIDGLPNEMLRYNDPVKFGVAGLNTAGVVNSNTTNSILPGLAPFFVSPDWPPTNVTETNFTIEQPLKGNSALRVSYVWTHGSNLDVIMHPNTHPTNYQWEMAYGIVPPTGGAAVIGTSAQNTYSATATGPYDQTTWANFDWHTRAGWSNYDALQVNYQRLYHHGYAYQLTYVFDKAMRMGGNQVDAYSAIATLAGYPGILGTIGTMTSPNGTPDAGMAPPARPSGAPVWADYHALNDYEQYKRDSSQPTMHI
ncbi:MAG: carboxypeptidase regulatory-like domain-containing protein, partial [Terriglobia bacterium]